MRTFGNIIWHFPFLGFLQSLAYAIGGAFWCITIIGIPLGMGLFQLSLFTLSPFSKRLVSQHELEMITGEKQESVVKGWFFIVRILYFPLGLLMAIATIFIIIAQFISIIGIPCGIVQSKALATIFNPVNKKCVPLAVAKEIERRKANNVLNKYEKRTPAQNSTTAISDNKINQIEETKTTIAINSLLTCPRCHKEMAEDWELCPYCGYNSKEEEEKKQEEDNLRFAPPQYRK